MPQSRIPLFDPRLSDAAISAVATTLRSGRLSEGPGVKKFEDDFCTRFALPRALALNSGTSALHLALLVAGVGAGDEVVTTAQTFVATALAVRYVGATPVFADLEENGPNLDPVDVARRITRRTRAILVVHYGGYPCAMAPLRALAAEHDLTVIEDAAHALGATYRDQPVGALGDAACFSFQAIKPMTTGDGGMLVCMHPEWHEHAYRLRWFGIDRERRRPSVEGEPEWDITEIGYKYHMNDVAAAMGIAELDGVQSALGRRRQLEARYRSQLVSVPGVTLLDQAADRTSAAWLFTVLVERRADFCRAVRSRGVDCGAWHRRIDRHSLFGGARDLPRQARFDEMQVCLPLRDSLTDEESERVVRAVRQGW